MVLECCKELCVLCNLDLWTVLVPRFRVPEYFALHSVWVIEMLNYQMNLSVFIIVNYFSASMKWKVLYYMFLSFCIRTTIWSYFTFSFLSARWSISNALFISFMFMFVVSWSWGSWLLMFQWTFMDVVLSTSSHEPQQLALDHLLDWLAFAKEF